MMVVLMFAEDRSQPEADIARALKRLHTRDLCTFRVPKRQIFPSHALPSIAEAACVAQKEVGIGGGENEAVSGCYRGRGGQDRRLSRAMSWIVRG